VNDKILSPFWDTLYFDSGEV